MEKERNRRRLELAEYKAQVKKQLVHKHLALKSIIDEMRVEIENSEIDNKDRNRAILKLDSIESQGDYTDIIKMSEMEKFASFKEFRLALE